MTALDSIAYHFLRRFFPRCATAELDSISQVGHKYVPRLLPIAGPNFIREWQELTVLDFGCGTGSGAVELAESGLPRVVGYDIRQCVIRQARELADQRGIGSRCEFTATSPPHGSIDIVISVDAFEHFDDPADVLERMSELLTPHGKIIATFGPTWLHPRGGHLFSAFPWAHLILPETALCRWRADFRDDGATRFEEVEGGLNRMTIANFQNIVKESSMQFQHFTCRPIQRLSWLHNRLSREWLTSVVDCVLVRKQK